MITMRHCWSCLTFQRFLSWESSQTIKKDHDLRISAWYHLLAFHHPWHFVFVLCYWYWLNNIQHLEYENTGNNYVILATLFYLVHDLLDWVWTAGSTVTIANNSPLRLILHRDVNLGRFTWFLSYDMDIFYLLLLVLSILEFPFNFLVVFLRVY